MKVKVCGLRSPENILAVSALSVDWLGFIFYQKSPRFVGKKTGLDTWLTENRDRIPQKRFGVFVNAGVNTILNAVHDYELDFVQLHGNESPGFCSELQMLWKASSARSADLVKAFTVDGEFDFKETQAYTPFCRYFLFDTPGPGYGGTGRQFDWNLLTEYEGATPFILSGGIGPDSAGKLLELQMPQMSGIDINSKFELEPGIKDLGLIRQFLQTLKP